MSNAVAEAAPRARGAGAARHILDPLLSAVEAELPSLRRSGGAGASGGHLSKARARLRPPRVRPCAPAEGSWARAACLLTSCVQPDCECDAMAYTLASTRSHATHAAPHTPVPGPTAVTHALSRAHTDAAGVHRRWTRALKWGYQTCRLMTRQ